ncbi:MAG TPA: reverse transcriptase domain-containing protein [Chlamydiales bacterium]|nr:reverse transcriptase domain-containing protein [Chlamydiales bacterium]
MREIGCAAFVLKNNITKTPKIYDRSIECILIGYAENSKAYRCYDSRTGKIHISRNVRFIESLDQEPHPLRPGIILGDISTNPVEPSDIIEAPNDIHDVPGDGEPIEIQPEEQRGGDDETDGHEHNQPIEVNRDEIHQLRRSQRVRNPSAAGAAMQGIEITTRTQRTVQQVRDAAARLKHKEKEPTVHVQQNNERREERVDEEEEEEGEEGEYFALLDENEESEEECYGSTEEGAKTWKEAAESDEADQWRAAYQEEMDSLKKHDVWTLIPRSQVPKGRKVIKSRPCFVRKKDENGKVVRHKVRVVAKGFTQVAGVDFTETFASVARMESMRTLLHIGATNDWEIHQMDVKTAFLHGDLEEDIYMEQPAGMEEPGKENWVALLNKSLYGLRQAGRRWAKKLHKSMTEEGFTQISVEHSLYIRKSKTGTALVAVHVDDMAVAASTGDEIRQVAHDLNKHFEMVDLGPIKWMLGIAIEHNRKLRTISLSQVAYIDSIIEKFNQEEGYKVSTPLDYNAQIWIYQMPH